MPIVSSEHPVLLIGGADVDKTQLQTALALCKTVVAADGGAKRALAAGIMPDVVIGDLDSLPPETRAQIAPERIHAVAEQDSTDFEKCLREISAPLVLALGFVGRRQDHTLAAFTVLMRRPQPPCVLLGRKDVICAAPEALTLDLPIGSRVSLYPLQPVTGRSEGLEWPIDGLVLSPMDRVGTSNRVVQSPVRLWFDCQGVLLILPDSAYRPLLASLASG